MNLRIEKLLYDKQFISMRNDVPKTINLIKEILHVKTLKSLMRLYLNRLGDFFGFETAVVLFFDNETRNLYRLTFAEEF